MQALNLGSDSYNSKDSNKKKVIGLVVVAAVVLLTVIIVISSNIRSSKYSQSTTEATTSAPKTWILKHYVDEFNEEDATLWYIISNVNGNYKYKSRGDGRPSTFKVACKYNNSIIFYLNDGYSIEDGDATGREFTVKYKDSSGSITTTSGYMNPGSDELYVRNSIFLISAIHKGNLTVVVNDSYYPYSQYKFDIIKDNFVELYHQQRDY